MAAAGRRLLLLSACVTVVASAQERIWLDLMPPADTGRDALAPLSVEVDVKSIAPGPFGPEAVLRVTAARNPRTHVRGYRYRSFVAAVRIGCEAGQLTPVAATYYTGRAGSGPEAASESDLTQEGVDAGLLDMLPAHVREALRKAACVSA